MMPDAEPIAETIEADATDTAASEIVDLTDTAVADPTDAGPAVEPDAATDEATASRHRSPTSRRRPTGATVIGKRGPSCSSRWWCWARRP